MRDWFFSKEARGISRSKQAAKLARAAAEGRIKTVALTVNAADAEIKAIVSEVRPDFLQLHGAESLERIAGIRAISHARVSSRPSKSARRATLLAAHHFETRRRSVALRRASRRRSPVRCRAETASPSIGPGCRRLHLSPISCFLADLTLLTCSKRLSASGALAVDVSSGVETSPGVKSPALIRQFIKTAKSFEPVPARVSAAP